MSQLQPFLCKASTKSQASQIPRKRYKPNGSVTATPLKPITVAPVTLVTLLRSKGGGDERHRPPPGPNPTQSISSCVSAREPSRDYHEQNFFASISNSQASAGAASCIASITRVTCWWNALGSQN